MELDIHPDKYIIAVSGGVDSVALLNQLVQQQGQASVFSDQESEGTNNRDQIINNANLQLVVAHFDHGIRPDSESDRKFVEGLAKKYALRFEYKREELGPDASEELARVRRYIFLNEVKDKYGAKAIITAHHRDDVIETAALNIIRGTYRRGISSLKSREVLRPLLKYSKKQILDYARAKNLKWREDSTNQDQKYIRNKVRARLQKATELELQRVSELIGDLEKINDELDGLTSQIFDALVLDAKLDRQRFIALPHDISREVVAHWLRLSGIEFDKKTLERLVAAFKTAVIGTALDAGNNQSFVLSKNQIGIKDASSV